jgi:3-oxoacyl-[acyl-carrier-protein] synthase II
LTTKDNWTRLITGQTGIGPITTIPCKTFPIKIAGEVKQFNPATYNIKTKSLKLMNKTIQFALAAAWCAVRDAGIDPAAPEMQHYGLALGVEGVQYTAEDFFLASYAAAGDDMASYVSVPAEHEKRSIKTKDPYRSVHPLWPLTVLPNMSLSHVSMLQKIQGPNLVFSSIDAAGAQAIGEAFRAIRSGAGDVYLAGGSYALNTIHLLSFATLQLLSHNSDPQQACRPFDCSRDGSVLGEGAVILIIEELCHAQKRGAPVYAELAGYSSCVNGLSACPDPGCDAPDWQGMHQCMSAAIQDAGIEPSDIDCITADGKATVQGDRREAQAILQTFNAAGAHIPVSSNKSALGHLLPASGAASAAITALSLYEGVIPPTLNHNHSEPENTVHIISQTTRRKDLRYALSNTCGFTGEHTSLVFKQYH